MRKGLFCLLIVFVLLACSGCTVMDGLSRSDALPDLRLLVQPAYVEPEAEVTSAEAHSSFQLDLWLDASPLMGGINPNEQSMYPHSSRKYREGGFHYRYQNRTGMYETVLRCMLSAAEDTRVRILRCGSERLPDAYLREQVDANAGEEQLRSLRRDMLTYAIDPLPDLFKAFSAEKMTDSFYSPGTVQLNQIPNLDSRLLENPSLTEQMNAALQNQIRVISSGKDASLNAAGRDDDYPLLYALNNLDLSRLSVITFDPAGIRRLNQTDRGGAAHALVEELLRERGVFDSGLAACLYAFTLDYMGQMSSFAAADFSEPLLWGRLDYSNYTGQTKGELVMPRTLLTLVIGQPAQVEVFTASFERALDASDTLRVPRGPQDGQLTYTLNGQTVIQQPFGFTCDYTVISRAETRTITQQTEGAVLSAADAAVSRNGSLYTVTLPPVNGLQPDRTLSLTLPLSQPSGSIRLEAEKLTNLQLTVQDALLLSDILPNHPSSVIPEGAQSIALRDRLYVFSNRQAASPVSFQSLKADGDTLTVALKVDGAALQPGYYRMLFTADLPGESLEWQTPEWVNRLNTDVSNEQISAWEAFTKVLTRYERKRDFISVPYQHAWGDADNTDYYGEPVPDFPPVMLAPGLSTLIRQLQNAALPASLPYIHFVFDLFVPNQPL